MFDMPNLALATALGAAAFLAGGALLLMLSTPEHAEARLLDAGRKYEAALNASRSAGASADLPAHAICTDAGGVDSALRARLNALIGPAKASLGAIRIDQSASPEQMLTTVALDVEARGQEGEVRGLLAGLAGPGPLLIVDSLDLTSDGKVIAMRLKAHFLCHARRLP